jgi:two-component system sensor histidine kinase AgrC
MSTFIVAAIGLAILLVTSVNIMIYPILSVKKSLILFVSLIVSFLIGTYFDFGPWILIVFLFNSFLIAKLTSKNYTSLCFPIIYLLTIFLFHLSLGAMNKLTDSLTQERDQSIFWLAFNYCWLTIASALIVFLVKKLIKKNSKVKSLFEDLENASDKLIYATAGILIIDSQLCYTISDAFYDSGILDNYLVIVISALFFYLVFSIVLTFLFLSAAKKNYENEKKIEYLDNLNEYTKNLEVVYSNMRSFKHDYVNIMAALSAYIDEKKYDELETFFYEHILPMNKSITQKNETINNLQKIKNMELKSILYTKMILAVNQNIEATIDIPDEIKDVNMDPVDLTRTLGVYMDNAIEASLETEKPVLNLHMGKVDNDVVCIISNNYIDKGISIAQMQKKDVTTKGKGHGLGLYNVSEILNKYNNIFHETHIENGLFVQQLRIS